MSFWDQKVGWHTCRDLRCLAKILVSVPANILIKTQRTAMKKKHMGLASLIKQAAWLTGWLIAYEDRCKILKWNSLEWRREFLSLVECCKIIFSLNGLNFSDYFELCKSIKTRSNHQYKIQYKIQLNCYKYSFFVKIIKFCHDLPSNVINCHDSPNINKFKVRLKNHMNIYWMYIPYFVKDVSVIFIKIFLLTSFYIMYIFLLLYLYT